MQVDDPRLFFNSLMRIEKLENGKDELVFRSFPPHMNSALSNQPSRTYGGTSVCYAFLAAKIVHGEQPNSISLFYLRPGSCELPIDIKVKVLSRDKMFVEVIQCGYTLSRAYVKKNVVDHWKIMDVDRKLVESFVKPPDFYEDDDRNYFEKITKTARKERNDVYASPFNVRFVDYGSVQGSKETSLFWVRVPSEQKEHFKTKNISPDGFVMYISDYFICQPAAISLRNNGRYFRAIGSLNHHVDVIQHDFDPLQWFLIQSTLESMTNDRSIFRFVVWSEAKTVVASGRQECYTPKIVQYFLEDII